MESLHPCNIYVYCNWSQCCSSCSATATLHQGCWNYCDLHFSMVKIFLHGIKNALSVVFCKYFCYILNNPYCIQYHTSHTYHFIHCKNIFVISLINKNLDAKFDTNISQMKKSAHYSVHVHI